MSSKPIEYTLYKSPSFHDNIGCKETLDIVRYIHYKYNVDIRPTLIFERNYPEEVTSIPSISLPIRDGYVYFVGRNETIRWYHSILMHFRIIPENKNITQEAKEWALKNPNYRINDNL